MGPEQAIAALDRAIDSVGEQVTLRRETKERGVVISVQDVDVRIVARGHRPYELVGGVMQDASSIWISPTDMRNNEWCWPVEKRDVIIIDGKEKIVEEADPIKLGGQIVRYEISVE